MEDMLIGVSASILGTLAIVFAVGSYAGFFNRDRSANYSTIERLLNENTEQSRALMLAISQQHKDQTDAICNPLESVCRSIEKLLYRDEETAKKEAVRIAMLDRDARS